MQYWEEKADEPYHVPDDIQDISFKINGGTLPIDHAWALYQALKSALPWLDDEPQAAIHEIHVAASGNGWFRPEDAENEILCLSRRTRMYIRLPKERLDDAKALSGQTLDVDGHLLTLGTSSLKPLSTLGTQFSRHIITDEAGFADEMAFMHQVAERMRTMRIGIRRMMCGRSQRINTPDGTLLTRSVMFADMEPEDAVHLQQHGMGEHQKLGCGIFIPHKGIDPVSSPKDD